ncbi:anti-Muellerian hormone type-2 receptor-like [Chanos chanos]|uniref:receptor protein serine/threonine kinase n=1 Tax=Chanos chanos TaxID=29144 RepID=A0A6J2VPR7_CHACN|nr:anti-Muellerian hormone type-2 receptor [Chanos chanos]
MLLWLLFAFLGQLSVCIPAPASASGRKCAFLASPRNLLKILEAGNITAGVQDCEHTHCCMGYFQLVDGQPRPDLLGCNILEGSCPESLCSASTHFHNYIRCVCNSDFCNSNISWSPQRRESQHSYTPDLLSAGLVIFPVGFLIVCCSLIAAWRWRSHFRDCNKRDTASHERLKTFVCSCGVSEKADIDLASVELQKVVAQGRFASVWQGQCHGSPVALKIFPAGHSREFMREKEVYALPLMVNCGIACFLGAGRTLERRECVLVLELAAHGSLNAFLSKTACDWKSAVKLTQTLSQGLAYLHSDINKNGVHKPAVAHRDLSSNNVLVRADGTCALCDFGCATVIRHCTARDSWHSHVDNTQDEAQVGTLRYMSPEMLEGSVNLSSGHCLMQGDVYALGLLLWELWSCCSDLYTEGHAHSLPYEVELGPSPALEQLLVLVSERRQRPAIPQSWIHVSQEFSLQEILEDCWDHDPEARLSAQCAANRLASLPPHCSL